MKTQMHNKKKKKKKNKKDVANKSVSSLLFQRAKFKSRKILKWKMNLIKFKIAALSPE